MLILLKKYVSVGNFSIEKVKAFCLEYCNVKALCLEYCNDDRMRVIIKSNQNLSRGE